MPAEPDAPPPKRRPTTWKRGQHLMHRELELLPEAELVARFLGPAPEGRTHGWAYYDDIALALRKQGEPGVNFLLDNLRTADTNRARATIFALGLPPELPSARGLLTRFLRDRRPLVVVQAIDAARRLGVRDVHDSVVAMRAHRSPFVRGAVLRYVGQLFRDEALPSLLAALHDQSHIVRQCALDVLDDAGFSSALPALRPLLDDRHAGVRQAAESAVANLERLAKN